MVRKRVVLPCVDKRKAFSCFKQRTYRVSVSEED